MQPANRYVIRKATDDDDGALRRLAELDGQRPLAGPTLIAGPRRSGVAGRRARHRRPVPADRRRKATAVHAPRCRGSVLAHALAPEPPGAALGTVRAAPPTAYSTA